MKIRRFLSAFLLIFLLSGLLTVPALALDEPDIQARSAILIDMDTGKMLYGMKEHSHQYPASTTKVMTALLTLEAVERGELRLDELVTPSNVTNYNLLGASNENIRSGEQMSVENLLYCLLVSSANESADILAVRIAGSVPAFADMMNQRAAQLGCTDTHFVNPNGMHDADHYSSAWDLYLITAEARKHELFCTICSTVSYTVPATNMSGPRVLHATNSLISNWRILGYLYNGADGVKTGHTNEAGYCLIATATRGERHLLSVVLGAEGQGAHVESFSESAELLDYGFDSFSVRTVLKDTDLLQEVPVSLSKEANYVVVHPAQEASSLLPNDVDVAALERKISLDPALLDRDGAVKAPLTEGQVLGTVSVYYEGEACVTVPLLALSSVNASSFLVGKAAVKEFLSRRIVQIALGALLVLIVVVFLWLKFFRRKRRYTGHGRRYRQPTYRGRRRH